MALQMANPTVPDDKFLGNIWAGVSSVSSLSPVLLLSRCWENPIHSAWNFCSYYATVFLSYEQQLDEQIVTIVSYS
jgi:hypothetical protein